jgi:hypothetical protein
MQILKINGNPIPYFQLGDELYVDVGEVMDACGLANSEFMKDDPCYLLDQSGVRFTGIDGVEKYLISISQLKALRDLSRGLLTEGQLAERALLSTFYFAG